MRRGKGNGVALLFCDSFDHYLTVDAPLKWTQAGWQSLGVGTGRNGTGGLYLQASAEAKSYVRRVFGSQKTTLFAGVAFKVPTGTINTGYVPIIGFDDQTVPGEQISLNFDCNQNKLAVFRNGTLVATGTTVLSTGVFYFLEFKATIHNTTGVYEVRINETVEAALSASGVNTRGAGTNNSANAVRLGGDMGVGIFGGGSFKVIGYFDDFWCVDDQGAVNDTYLGDCRVQCLLPNGTGANTTWTPLTGANFQNEDEQQMNSDTDYVATGGVGNIDTYTMQDLIPTTGTVKAVQAVISARKDDSGTRQIAPVFRIGGTNYAGVTQSIETTYAMKLQEYDKSPATAAAWTISEVNAAEFGGKLVA